jgi:SAM-dependent methyltransferase
MVILKRSTQLPIKEKCDFCLNRNLEHVYTPIRSARGMEVYVCSECGLVQSFPTIEYQSRPPGSMSSDADRSSYRYTKDVISDRYEKCFKGHVDFTKIKRVLDIGSNRGAFIRHLESNYPGMEVVGIEPDESVTHTYSSLTNVSVQNCRFEDAILPENYFDFAYCAHTLEHADSAREMLLGIRRALKPGALFFVAVPNLIFYEDIIEELFIDPHTYHFNFNLLKNFSLQIGFSVEYSGGLYEPDLVLLLKKQETNHSDFVFLPTDRSLADTMKKEIICYKKNIVLNRIALKGVVDRINAASVDNRVVIWGGGRIFDALIRFGGLDSKCIYKVVDKFLFRYASEINGMKLDSPSALLNDNPDNIIVFIASRNYAEEIRVEASEMGINKFIQFGSNV